MRIDGMNDNNVVIIKDENGKESFCGKGIAYKKRRRPFIRKADQQNVLLDCSETAFSEIISGFLWRYIQITTRLWRCSHKHWKTK